MYFFTTKMRAGTETETPYSMTGAISRPRVGNTYLQTNNQQTHKQTHTHIYKQRHKHIQAETQTHTQRLKVKLKVSPLASGRECE